MGTNRRMNGLESRSRVQPRYPCEFFNRKFLQRVVRPSVSHIKVLTTTHVPEEDYGYSPRSN